MVQDGWLDEQRLVQGLRARNPRVLETLIAQYSHEFFYFIRLVLEGIGSVQDAEECVNDLFVTVWQDFDSFDPTRGSLRTWLTMRAKYIALDRRRHLTRRNPSGALVTSHLADQYASQELYGSDDLSREAESMSQRMGDSLDTLLEQRERREEVRRALERLPNLDRLLVYLRYFQLASIDEIAQRTGLSKHAVDTRLWRVRKSLRVVLQEQVHDAPLKTTKRA
ncbi:MAG TPA: sigma-70 family RNA polymerase sigma factor [Ktedonobacterales bacterium]|nr:sigma-70 family RNA polymerase sigma factor [Ktedonobacterales bacterium]